MNPLKRLLGKFRELQDLLNRIEHNTLLSGYEVNRQWLIDKILHCNAPGVTDKKYCEHNITVSLTTYGKRLWEVPLAIESIMQQTCRPNRIVLWLDDYLEENPLPAALESQVKRGLTIRYTRDIRSFKKLIPALKEYPEDVIITVDDDIFYNFDLLERLIRAHNQNSKVIFCPRFHTMTFDVNGKVKPYAQWIKYNFDEKGINRNLLSGGSGVLYPPHSLSPKVFDEGVFTSICPTADDVWFTAMAILNGTEIRKIETRSSRGEDYIYNESVQDTGLFKINILGEARNDAQIKAVFDRYDIYRFIK